MTATEQAMVAFWSPLDPQVRRDRQVGPEAWSRDVARRHLELLFGQDAASWPTKDQTVLEIGCGEGRLMEVMAPMVRRMIGLDVSSVMLEGAIRRLQPHAGTDLDFFQVSPPLWDFPVESGVVHQVYSFLCFQHLHDRGVVRQYLEESHRVLRDGGIIRIQNHRGIPAQDGQFHGMAGEQYRTIEEFAGEFTKAGFAVAQALQGAGHPEWQVVVAQKV